MTELVLDPLRLHIIHAMLDRIGDGHVTSR